MNKKMIRLSSVALIAGLSIVGLTACANTNEVKPEVTTEPTTEATPTAAPSPEATDSELAAPIIVELEELNGSVVNAFVGGFVYIRTGSVQVDAVTGVVSDEKIATFLPGTITDSMVTNPGLDNLKKGSTQVTLDDGSGNAIIFTLVVSEKA